MPAEVADLAWQNKAAVYDLLFRAASETMMTIAADPRHLGARIELKAASVQILVDHPANEADPLPLLLTGYPQATGLPAKAICCG